MASWTCRPRASRRPAHPGGPAFFDGWLGVAAGFCDVALVIGVEKMTSQPRPEVAEIVASAGEVQGEMKAGARFPALFARIARRHTHQFGTRHEHLAAVAVRNHANAAKTPLAHMRKIITLEQARAGRPVAEPLSP